MARRSTLFPSWGACPPRCSSIARASRYVHSWPQHERHPENGEILALMEGSRAAGESERLNLLQTEQPGVCNVGTCPRARALAVGIWPRCRGTSWTADIRVGLSAGPAVPAVTASRAWPVAEKRHRAPAPLSAGMCTSSGPAQAASALTADILSALTGVGARQGPVRQRPTLQAAPRPPDRQFLSAPERRHPLYPAAPPSLVGREQLRPQIS